MIDGHYESFVVRLWVRGGEIARGEVSRTVSGETERFVDLHALSRFLVESVALAGSRSSDSRGDHPAENGDAAHGPNERVVELRRGRAGNEVASDD
ncbi:MAG: hypothetical protein R3C39_14545 [Dehalococcoidia bacterium]